MLRSISYKIKHFFLFITLIASGGLTYFTPLIDRPSRLIHLVIGFAIMLSIILFLIKTKVRYEGWGNLFSFRVYFAGLAILQISNIIWGIYSYVYFSSYVWIGILAVVVCMTCIIKWWCDTKLVIRTNN